MEQRQYDQDLADFKRMLLTMGGHAETIVRKSLKALVERDDDIAWKVMQDDKIIDQFEIDVDEQAIVLLSRAPLAGDLRLITIGMKISQELERVGDEATTIARQTLSLNLQPPLRLNTDLQLMASKALEMLKGALDAFVNLDADRAREIVPRDKVIDQYNKELRVEVAEKMKASSETVDRALCIMTISKCLERIGDHASNIAEEVVFLRDAQDIRHQKKPIVA
jgi:phosphate transport system protein